MSILTFGMDRTGRCVVEGCESVDLQEVSLSMQEIGTATVAICRAHADEIRAGRHESISVGFRVVPPDDEELGPDPTLAPRMGIDRVGGGHGGTD